MLWLILLTFFKSASVIEATLNNCMFNICVPSKRLWFFLNESHINNVIPTYVIIIHILNYDIYVFLIFLNKAVRLVSVTSAIFYVVNSSRGPSSLANEGDPHIHNASPHWRDLVLCDYGDRKLATDNASDTVSRCITVNHNATLHQRRTSSVWIYLK